MAASFEPVTDSRLNRQNRSPNWSSCTWSKVVQGVGQWKSVSSTLGVTTSLLHQHDIPPQTQTSDHYQRAEHPLVVKRKFAWPKRRRLREPKWIGQISAQRV